MPSCGWRSRAFLAEGQKRRPAVSSQARTTAALKCFFRFLVEEERLVRDPALPLRTRYTRVNAHEPARVDQATPLGETTGRGNVGKNR